MKAFFLALILLIVLAAAGFAFISFMPEPPIGQDVTRTVPLERLTAPSQETP